jgi:hypothetical protein
MDAEGARELARRIGSNAGVTSRPVPANVSEGAQPLYRWFGGDAAAHATESSSPPARPSRRPRSVSG